MDWTEIPKGTHETPGPCWFPVATPDGDMRKPRVRCTCGKICLITLHHVHPDGTVTASFFDSKESSFIHNGKTYYHQPGCGWHVHLKLLDYDLGEFPPEEDY